MWTPQEKIVLVIVLAVAAIAAIMLWDQSWHFHQANINGSQVPQGVFHKAVDFWMDIFEMKR
jgi:hypothetical protein